VSWLIVFLRDADGKIECIKLCREELWQKTSFRRGLAKQYSLSDVGLAKICKKMGMPRSERDH